MVQQVAIVWNPSKTTREALDEALAAALSSSGDEASVEWIETSEDDPGRGAAEQALASGAELVIAAGGDGTVRAVAEVLAEQGSAELGIAPLGTGNLLARNLDVPIDDLAVAMTRAITHEASVIDVGWLALDGGAEKQAFAVMAGFGIDAHMITETDDELKSRVGWLAYVESLGRAVSSSEVIDVTVSEDGEEPARTQAHTMMIGNCGTVQGGITLLPDADPRDGELDLLLIDAEGVGGWLDTMRNMLWDNGLKKLMPGTPDDAESSKSIGHRSAKKIRIELAEPREIELDGDVIGKARVLDVEVQPSALRVR
ncbi:diacylglycerol/lipid kinase family protein [Microbacterium sp.]|uniref:diacylglycerol/lipid kinase family protein n=1 Tax=Microbacterium sp. TaxID=51671 RepID=UPI003F965257